MMKKLKKAIKNDRTMRVLTSLMVLKDVPIMTRKPTKHELEDPDVIVINDGGMLDPEFNNYDLSVEMNGVMKMAFKPLMKMLACSGIPTIGVIPKEYVLENNILDGEIINKPDVSDSITSAYERAKFEVTSKYADRPIGPAMLFVLSVIHKWLVNNGWIIGKSLNEGE